MNESEIRKALDEVERSNRQLDHAFDHLREKIDYGSRRVEFLLDRAQVPVRFLRAKPLYLAPVAFFGGLLLGKLLADSFASRRQRQLIEALPSEGYEIDLYDQGTMI